MLKIIGLIVLVAIIVVLALAARKPDTFRIERSIVIHAPPQRIFALIDDFHRWQSWSPYEKLDPAMQRSYRGPDNGSGAGYAWDSKGKAGQGSMEITESLPSTHIAIRLEFVKPFRASNVAEFTLQPQGDATEVRWSMHGPSPFVIKLMKVFFDMDRMIGKDFETGLAQLKEVAEQPAVKSVPGVAVNE